MGGSSKPAGDSFVQDLKRRKYLRLLGLTGAAGMAGCVSGLQDGEDENTQDGTTQDNGNEEPIHVGVVVPFSGDAGQYGPPVLDGMSMAMEDINAAGGPLGREIELVDADSRSDATQAVNAANRLINTDGVKVLAGAAISSVTISIAKSATIPNDTMHLVPSSSSPLISQLDDKDLVFRTKASDNLVARVMANIVADKGGESASVIYVDNDFGRVLADVFEENFEGETVAKVGYKSGESNYENVLSKAYADDPDWAAFAGYPESGTSILTQWYEGGYGGKWVLHNAMLSSEIIQDVGPEIMNSMWAARTKPPTKDATEEFNQEFEEKYPDKTNFTPFSWNGYDSLMSYALAVHRAGTTDPMEVKEHMRTVSNPPGEAVSYDQFGDGTSMIDEGTEINYHGPSGQVNYDENGDTLNNMSIIQIVDGEIVEKGTVSGDDLV
jgi:branched-chain amino acid transport system substrate-binding protein